MIFRHKLNITLLCVLLLLQSSLLLTTTHAQPRTPSTAADIASNGTLLAGVKFDFPPFGEGDPDTGEVEGFDIDLVQAMADAWGVEVKFVPVTSANRIDMLEQGKVHLVAASMTHTRDRDETIDFSQVYYLDGQGLLVADESVKTLEDLAGKVVAVIEGSTSLDNIAAAARRQDVNLTIRAVSTISDTLIAELEAGELHAITSDRSALESIVAEHPTLTVAKETFTQEPYGIGVRQGDSAFRELVNRTLQTLKQVGTYDDIYDQWFSGDPYEVELFPGPYDDDGNYDEDFAETFNDLADDPFQGTIEVFERIFDEEQIRIGIKGDFPPLAQNEEGFEADLAREIGRRWFGDEDAVELVTVTSSDRIPKLVEDEIDLIIASMTHNWERIEEIDVSQTYFLDGQSLLVRKGEGIESVEDLNGRSVAVLQGSTSIQNILAEAQRLQIQIQLQSYTTVDEALEALNDENVAAFTSDSVLLIHLAQENPGLEVVGGTFTREPYAIGIPQGEYRLRELVNFTVQDMKQDGTYDALYAKWFGAVLDSEESYPIQILPGTADDYLPPAQLLNSRLRLIRDRGNVLIVGVKDDFPPFGYIDDTGDWVGFDLDLVRAMAEVWGVEVKFEPVTSANRIPRLLAGEIDLIAASMTHSGIRDEFIDFSQTYFKDGQSLLVRCREPLVETDEGCETDITGVNATLDGGRVAALEGSTSIDNIQIEAEKQGIEIEIVLFIKPEDAIEALKAGEVDAFTTDSVALSRFANRDREKTDGPPLKVVGGLFTDEPYGLGLPSGDSYFRDLVNCTLQALSKSGEYHRIYQRRFGLTAVPYNITSLSGECEYTFETAPDYIDQSDESVIDKMADNGTLIVAVRNDFPPFGFLDPISGRLVGFDVDLARELAQRWLGDENAVEFIQVEATEREEVLINDEAHLVAAAFSRTNDREAEIDFSQTYFLDRQGLLTLTSRDFCCIEDLDGEVIAAVEGTTSKENLLPSFKVEAQIRGEEIEPRLWQPCPISLSDLIIMLSTGQVPAITSDRSVLAYVSQDNPAFSLLDDGNFPKEPYGLGVPQFDPQFRDLVNFTLQEMVRDGTYDEIYNEWFPDEERAFELEAWPGPATLNHYVEVLPGLEEPPVLPTPLPTREIPPETDQPNPTATMDNGEPYIVKSGDSLSSIAAEFYGNAGLWNVIYDDNRGVISEPGSIEPGMELFLDVDLIN